MNLKKITTTCTFIILLSCWTFGTTILLPPILQLELPGENWKMTSPSTIEALVGNEYKKIIKTDGSVSIKVFSSHNSNLPFPWTKDEFQNFYDGKGGKNLTQHYIFNDFHIYGIKNQESKDIYFVAGKTTADGYFVNMNFKFINQNKEQSKKLLEDILISTKLISIEEMDRKFGFPLNPMADNSEYIKKRKADLVALYCENGKNCEAIEKAINKMEYEKLVPEMYDGFNFTSLYNFWKAYLEGSLDVNEYFDALLNKKESLGSKFMMKYADDHTSKLFDSEVKYLHRYFANYDKRDEYFRKEKMGNLFYQACDSNMTQTTHIWRNYYNESQTKAILLCFHKNGRPISDSTDWIIDIADINEINVKDWSRGIHSYISDNRDDCWNLENNFFGIKTLDSKENEISLLGIGTNPKTKFIKFHETKLTGFTVQYSFLSINKPDDREFSSYWQSKMNISDSCEYRAIFSDKFHERIDLIRNYDSKQLIKMVDKNFTESYEGNHGAENIDTDIYEQPLYYASNSLIFNIPKEERSYYSSLQFIDINGDSVLDACSFVISNGKIISSQIIYDLNGTPVEEMNPANYNNVLLSSEIGQFIKRVSLQDENLLYVEIPDKEFEEYR